MSIATAIAAAQQKVANAYTAVSNKGGTLPATQNLSNLPTAINSISGGVDTTGWIPKTISNNKIVMSSTLPDLTGVTDIGSYAFKCAFYSNSDISGALTLLRNIVTISGYYACSEMFYYCTGLTSVDLSSLTTISNSYALHNMFDHCTNITSVNLSNLATINSNNACYGMFRYCSRLTSITFNKLSVMNASQIFGYAFRNTGLTSLSFPALKSTSFGSYTDQFNNMLTGVTGCTVHFPSNLQSVIGSWTSVTAKFGGTNCEVLYDLPATS